MEIKVDVWEGPGIYMWFKLSNMHLAEFGSCLLKQNENDF